MAAGRNHCTRQTAREERPGVACPSARRQVVHARENAKQKVVVQGKTELVAKDAAAVLQALDDGLVRAKDFRIGTI